MISFIKKVFLISILGIPAAAFSQVHDSPIDSLVKGKFSFSGYVDVYYLLNNNRPKSTSNTGRSGVARAFDQNSEQTQIGLVQTKINYKQRKSEAVLDLVFGPNADLGNYGNAFGLSGSTKITSSLAIKQAYISYFVTPKFTLTAGQFGTHIGYEVIDAPVNYNYSLSNLFTNGPYYHLGAKGVYSISRKLSFMAGAVNNWDRIYDNNIYNTIISEIAFSPKEGHNIILNYIGGNEADQDSTQNIKQLLDLTVGFQLTPKYYAGLNAVQGFSSVKGEKMKYWGGVALYSNYAFTGKIGLGARAEYFDNTAGVQYIGKTEVTSLTLTGKITLADGHLFVKPELRMDMYKVQEGVESQQFEDTHGKYTKSSQTTVGLILIYKY